MEKPFKPGDKIFYWNAGYWNTAMKSRDKAEFIKYTGKASARILFYGEEKTVRLSNIEKYETSQQNKS